ARLDESGADLWQSDRRLYERAAADTRAALGDERFAAQRAAGRGLPFAAAVAIGAAVDVPDSPASSSGSDPATPGTDVLTAREHDALCLPVEGCSGTRARSPDRQQA